MTDLFSPLRLGAIELPNRIVMSSLTRNRAGEGNVPTPLVAEYYRQRASAGLILTEASPICPEAHGYPRTPGIHSEAQIAGWQGVTDAVHRAGGKIALQIWHVGRISHPDLQPGGQLPVAPSALRAAGQTFTGQGMKDFVTPRALATDEIPGLVATYARAARNAIVAGFDGVEVHAGNGYLLDQFLRSSTNQRTDAYGGSTENRARFITDIVKRARDIVGPNYPIMIKMNCDDFIPGGLEKEEALRVARVIFQAGIDCIEVTGGTNSESPLNIAAMRINKEEKEAYFKSYAEALKQQIAIPIMLVGGLRTPRVMEKIISEGIADFISMCRPFIREPGLIKRWKEGDPEKAKCISCNMCGLHVFKRSLRCYVENPMKAD